MKIKWKPTEVYAEVCEYLDKQDSEKDIIVYISKKETKEMRTLAQNKTFWKLFTDIWNHLWEKKENVKEMMLWGVFWTEKIKVWRITREINIEKHTHKLTKEQWIHFIDSILAFTKKYNMPITVTPRELQNLYDSYKIWK